MSLSWNEIRERAIQFTKTYALLSFILLTSFYCVLFQKKSKVKPIPFNYQKISENYFSYQNEKPFPLTVQRGNNLYNSVTLDGKYLFYTTDNKGNYDIWFRDLNSSIIVPVTEHPSAEYKPAISPDGRKLVFVSEQYDSEGDLIFLKIEPEKWVKKLLKGKRFTNQDFEILTNPNKMDHYIDTDPVWSADGNSIFFSSNRLSPGIPNIVMYNVNTKEYKLITKKGATSPFASLDGKYLVYLSFKDSKYGEIYQLELSTGKEFRLTNNNYMEFSPSFSLDSKYLIYTSIREDSNENGELDERDNSYIVKYNIENKKENFLSTGRTSIFDTKYSNFNGGSILYSAALYNSINIYFIPFTGSIPKQANIKKQYEYALMYKDTQSLDNYMLALDSVKLFFENDPLYPIFHSKVDIAKAKRFWELGKKSETNQILDKMFRDAQNNKYGLSYVLAYSFKNKNILNNKSSVISGLNEYISQFPESQDYKQVRAAIMDFIGDELTNFGKKEEAKKIFQNILNQYLDYYDFLNIKRKIGTLSFQPKYLTIPQGYIELINSKDIDVKNKIKIQNDLEKKIFDLDMDYSDRYEILDKIIEYNQLGKNSKQLDDFFVYLKAKTLSEGKRFAESNFLLETFLPKLPESNDPLAPIDPVLPNADPMKKNPLFLKAHLLKSKNYENLGSLADYFRELWIYLLNYDPEMEVKLDKKDMENSFRYYESKAEEFEEKVTQMEIEASLSENKTIQNEELYKAYLRNVAFHYFYNAKNIYLMKSNGLFVDTLYQDYAIYYHKKMMDSVLMLGKKALKLGDDDLLNQINILGRNRLDVLGKTTSFLSFLLNNKFTNKFNFLGDFRDLRKHEIIDKQANYLIENHFAKDFLPKSRPALDLAAIYGYAYFLINKGVLYENYYNQVGVMTPARKTEVFRYLKQAEYELKWIIFADPQFTDAYQLLGWLYQQIDIVKSLPISSDEDTTDGELYASTYEKYFPEKHFEENIDLYLQILNFLGTDYPNKKVLSDLHLNLGNNYYLLHNYSKARDHFAITESYDDVINPNTRFENYKQEALFYFNYAKTLLYLSEYNKSTKYLKKVIRIYYEKEYYKAVASSNKVNEDGKKDYRILKEVNSKFVLLYALAGLSEMQQKKYDKAIHYFNRTLSFNLTANTNFIDNINIYNMLSICYQKVDNFSESEKYLQLAKKEYDEGRGKKSKSDISFFWNWILPEKNRIIGDSRFPGAFPIEYQRLLSYGIDAQNNLLRREYSETEQIYKKRKNFIEEKGLGESVPGQQILNNTLINTAYNEYMQGNYEKSLEIYKQVYEENQKNNNTKQYIKVFNRYNHTLFKYVEVGKENPKKLDKLIKENITNFSNLKKDFLTSCSKKPKYNELKKREVYKLCSQEFAAQFKDFDPLLGLNYYYLGTVLEKQSDEVSAFYYYGLAASVLENPSKVPEDQIGLSKDVFNRIERIRLKINLANVYLKLHKKAEFLNTIQDVEEMAYEYQSYEELAKAKLLHAQFLLQDPSKQNINQIDSLLKDSEKIVLSNYGLLYSISFEFLNALYETILEKEIFKRSYQELYRHKEKLQNILLFKNLISNNFEFEDDNFNDYYNELNKKIQKSISLNKEIENLNTKRKSIKVISERAEILMDYNQSISKFLENFINKYPEKEDFLTFQPSKKPSDYLSNEEVLYRFLVSKDKLIYWRITHKNTQVFHKDIKQSMENEVKNVLLKNSISRYKNIILMPDSNTIHIDFSKFSSLKGKSVYYAYKTSHLKVISELNHLKLKEVAKIVNSRDQSNQTKSPYIKITSNKRLGNLIYNVDILDAPLKEKYMVNNIFGESSPGTINLREIFEKKNKISLVILNNIRFNKVNYNQIVSTIDILRNSSIPIIYLLNNKNSILTTITQTALLNNTKNFVTIGLKDIQKSELSFSEKKYENYKALAYKAERIEDFENALKNFTKANAIVYKNNKKQLIESEINLSRVKTKLYRFSKEKEFYFYEALLDKYQNNEDYTFKIYDSLLTYCYTSQEEKNCDKLSKPFIDKIEKKINAKEKLPQARSVLFFRLVDGGKLKNFEQYYTKYLKIHTKDDEFLMHYGLSTFFLKNFLLEKSKLHAREALSYSENQKEKEKIYNRLNKITLQENFIKQEDKKITNISDQNNIYVLGIENKWTEFDKRVDEIYESQSKKSDKIVLTYKKKIYNIWRLSSIGGDYDPLYLTPDITGDGSSVYNFLESTDLALVYHLLLRSIEYQVDNEINSIFDILSEHLRKKGNLLMPAYMMVSWVNELCHRGDYHSAKQYIQKFETEYLKLKLPKELKNYYLFAKSKHAYLTNQKLVKNSNIYGEYNFWLSKYSQADQLSKTEEILPFLDSTVRQIGSKIFEVKNRKETLDLLSFLQNKAFRFNSSEAFLDIGFYKDKLNNFLLSQKNIKSSDIPRPILITEKLFQKLPKNQHLLAVINHGIKVFFINVYNKKTSADDAKIDNRELQDKIIKYYRAINENGSYTLQKDFLENKFRKAIFKNPLTSPILKKEPITYLYLSSFWTKVPLELRESDNFYLIQSPELLLERKMHVLGEDFEKGFTVKHHWNQTNESYAYQEIQKLIQYELDLNGNSNKSVINISAEDLTLKTQNTIYFGKNTIEEKIKTNEMRKGCWVLTNSGLYETSFKSNKFNYALMMLDNIHYGPGVISIGPQSNLSNFVFVKNLLQRQNIKTSLKTRFIDALDKQKVSYPSEYNWIGYRLYTNTLLRE